MADQFDLEQGIMECWNVTSDLDVLLEELVENQCFTQDQASNFVLGLSTIYGSKFEKLQRTFDSFLQTYYIISNELKQAQQEIWKLREEQLQDAIRREDEKSDEELQSLSDLFDEREEELTLNGMLSLAEEKELQAFNEMEDEFGFR